MEFHGGVLEGSSKCFYKHNIVYSVKPLLYHGQERFFQSAGIIAQAAFIKIKLLYILSGILELSQEILPGNSQALGMANKCGMCSHLQQR